MIIYNDDTLCIPVVDPFTKETSRYYFKVRMIIEFLPSDFLPFPFRPVPLDVSVNIVSC